MFIGPNKPRYERYIHWNSLKRLNYADWSSHKNAKLKEWLLISTDISFMCELSDKGRKNLNKLTSPWPIQSNLIYILMLWRFYLAIQRALCRVTNPRSADEKFIIPSLRQAFPNWPKHLKNRSNFHFKEYFKVPTRLTGPLILGLIVGKLWESPYSVHFCWPQRL